MKIETALFELSKSELRHKKQHDKSKSYYAHIPKVTIRNNQVYLFAYDDLVTKYADLLNLASLNDKPAIMLQKHSRYSYVPYHIHDYIEITYVMHGSLDEIIEGKKFHLTTGSIVFLNTQTIHKIGKTTKKDIAINILIKKEFLSDQIISIFPSQAPLAAFFVNCLSIENNQPDFFLVENCHDIKPIILEMIREQYVNKSNKEEILDMLIKIFFLRLLRSNSYNIYNSNQSQINKLLDYIAVNFRNITLNACAKHFNYNPNYLSTMIHNKTGKTFKQLVLEKKFKYINYMLLSSDLPIQEILDNVNVSNSTYFYQKFKKKESCTPTEYRHYYKKIRSTNDADLNWLLKE